MSMKKLKVILLFVLISGVSFGQCDCQVKNQKNVERSGKRDFGFSGDWPGSDYDFKCYVEKQKADRDTSFFLVLQIKGSEDILRNDKEHIFIREGYFCDLFLKNGEKIRLKADRDSRVKKIESFMSSDLERLYNGKIWGRYKINEKNKNKLLKHEVVKTEFEIDRWTVVNERQRSRGIEKGTYTFNFKEANNFLAKFNDKNNIMCGLKCLIESE